MRKCSSEIVIITVNISIACHVFPVVKVCYETDLNSLELVRQNKTTGTYIIRTYYHLPLSKYKRVGFTIFTRGQKMSYTDKERYKLEFQNFRKR